MDPHWRLLPGLLGALAGLSALVIAIVAGLQADNEPLTILVRGVLAMGGFWIGGVLAGWAIQRAVHADSTSGCDEVSGDVAISDDSLQTEESTSETQERREAA
ncbi:MAG: hypothetical protein MK116_00190 [Phycisphaerales bacterium]|nr:hypothetical protein [Phycisphaerales bacterium]